MKIVVNAPDERPSVGGAMESSRSPAVYRCIKASIGLRAFAIFGNPGGCERAQTTTKSPRRARPSEIIAGALFDPAADGCDLLRSLEARRISACAALIP